MNSTGWLLLNWNPAEAAPGTEDDTWRTTGIEYRQPMPGDPFLIKRCRHNPAIVGYGEVTSKSYDAGHWRDRRKICDYVKIKVMALYLESGLTVKALRLLGLDLPWEFQGAMCRISSNTPEQIRQVFDAIHGH